MNANSIKQVALGFLPTLETLYRARRQARWQYKAAAGEHKTRWIAVQAHLDAKIEVEENKVAEALGMVSYKGKRVFTK